MNTLDQHVMNLNKREQDRLFKILRDNADILVKVIPNIPLLEYIQTGTIDSSEHVIIQAYMAWKIKN